MSQRYIGGLIYNPPGGFSGYFDGSDDLNAPSNAAFTYGTSDFTIEGWFFITGRSGPNDYEYLFAQGATTGSSSLGVYRQGGVLKVWNGSAVITGTTTLTLNAWNHIALSRSGTTMRLFLNGAQEGSATNSNSISTGSSYGISVGRWTEVDTNYIVGYVSNFRVVKGTAVYTSAFTPPVGPLQAITNTSLLTCAYGTFRDGSTNNFTITVNGNTAVSTQNPFPLTTLPNPALGNQGNGVYSMSQYQSLLNQNLWPAVDPYWRNVTLLLHGNGTNGAQNNTFLDSSTNNFTITRNGNTTQGTFSPYGSNWSNYFDGVNNQYISAPNNTALSLPSGTAFTIEAWIFPTRPNNGAQSGFRNIISKRVSNSLTSNYNIMLWFNSEKLGFFNGSTSSLSAANIPQNTWTHFAYVYDGGTSLKLYINGILDTNFSTTPGATNSADVWIGSLIDDTGTYDNFGGYISNARIVKGSQVYTSNFTPSTSPLTAITNTSLLTCQSNRFIDNSTNAFTITRNGDVSVQRFSPFNPTAPYAASTDGGSGYFDGSGDYLSLANPNTNIGSISGDFTIECWINWITAPPGNASGNERQIIGQHSWPESTSGNWWAILGVNVGVYAYFAGGGSYDLIGSSSFTWNVGSWYHVAVVRSGSTVTIYVNGIAVGSGTSTKTLCADNVRPLTIGADNDGSHNASNAYISNMRLVKGTAVYTSAFTPPTAPLTAITNTSLLLNFTNAGIIDNAEMNNLETVGNAQISTAQSKFGGGSLAFDGSGDALRALTTPNLIYGSGDVTIEAWVYLNTIAGSPQVIVDTRASSAGSELLNFQFQSGVLYVYAGAYSLATELIAGTSAISATTWTHVAFVRSSGTNRLFVNGTQQSSNTNAWTQVLNSGTLTSVGMVATSTGNPMNGYIDDLRITKGYARYTANFTPQRSQWQDQ
jgi:hypothetical protein